MKTIVNGQQRNVKDIKVFTQNQKRNAVEMLVKKDGIWRLGWNNINTPPKPVAITNTSNNQIKIKFNQDINDIVSSGGTGELLQVATGKQSFSSGDYPGYESIYAVDGVLSTTSIWRSDTTALPVHIGVDLEKSYQVEMLKIYTLVYMPKDFILQASNDMTNWVDVSIGTLINTQRVWQEFSFTPQSYRYWRVYVTSKYYSSRVDICEIELYGREETAGVGQEVAFTLTDINNNIYNVNSVEKIDTNAILLTTDIFDIGQSFNVSYNSALGSLAGLNGAIMDFTKTFITQ